MTAILDARTVSAELIGVFPTGSPAWHAARAGGIGGSEIAAVLGLSAWESHFSLWHRKKGRIPPQMENTQMEAGKRLEPVICQKFADMHPELWVRTTGTWRNIDRPEQIANPDRLNYAFAHCECGARGDVLCSCPLPEVPDSLLEAKFALYPDMWGEEGTDEIPPYYKAQARWYLDVFGLGRCYVAVFIGSTGEFREYIVEPDPEDTALMRARAEAFLRSLRENRRPSIDGHDQTYRAVKQLPDGVEDIVVDIGPILAGQYLDALEAYSAAKTEKQLRTSLILDALGNARRAKALGEHIATRAVRADGTTHSLRAARPGREIKS